MAWYGWLLLLAVLAVPAIICGFLYSDKSGATHCIGCGECVRTGECVLNGPKSGPEKTARKKHAAEHVPRRVLFFTPQPLTDPAVTPLMMDFERKI